MRQFLWRVEDALRWIKHRTGLPSESANRHRRAIILWASLAFFVTPSTTVTFGRASLAGLGITVDPPLIFPIGWLLIILLFYRLAAFWVTVLSDAGTDKSLAETRARLRHDPEYFIPAEPAKTPSAIAQEVADKSMARWELFLTAWNVLLPNAFAIVSLSAFLWKHF